MGPEMVGAFDPPVWLVAFLVVLIVVWFTIKDGDDGGGTNPWRPA